MNSGLFGRYLKMSSLPGSKSWAQPGKIMDVLRAAGNEDGVILKKTKKAR